MRRRAFLGTLGGGLAGWAFAGSVTAGPVPTGGAGARSTGARAERAGVTVPGEVRWRFGTGAPVRSSPTVVDGVVHVGSDDGSLYALGASTGRARWRFPTGGPVRSSPTVLGGTVYGDSRVLFDGTAYVGSDDGGLYAVGTTDGSERWRLDTGAPVRSSPTASDHIVYVGSDDTNLYAVDATDGERYWNWGTVAPLRGSPTVDGASVYVGSEYVFGLLAGEHREFQSRFRPDGPVRSSATVGRQHGYIGSDDGGLYAFDIASGGEEWRFETGGPVRSSPTAVAVSPPGVTSAESFEDVLLVGSDDGGLYALDPDGERLWRFGTGAPVRSSPTVADETVFVGSDDGRVYAVDLREGTVRWRFETGGAVRSSPTVVGGVVYVGSDDGHVYAVDAGVSGESEGSRVRLGTLGHHGERAEFLAPPRPPDGTPAPIGDDVVTPTRWPTDTPAESPRTATATSGAAGPGFGALTALVAGGGALVRRLRRSGDAGAATDDAGGTGAEDGGRGVAAADRGQSAPEGRDHCR